MQSAQTPQGANVGAKRCAGVSLTPGALEAKRGGESPSFGQRFPLRNLRGRQTKAGREKLGLIST